MDKVLMSLMPKKLTMTLHRVRRPRLLKAKCKVLPSNARKLRKTKTLLVIEGSLRHLARVSLFRSVLAVKRSKVMSTSKR